MNIKNKVVAMLAVVLFVVPGITFAQTQSTADLQAQIAALLAQIQALQSQLSAQGGGSTTTTGSGSSYGGGSTGTTTSGNGSSCYTFTTNLSIGMSGSAVTQLQTDLKNDGESVQVTGRFDDQTAAAITTFQEKYASQILSPYGLTNGTGYAGKSTRAELNALFGCGGTNPTPVPAPIVIGPAPAPTQPTQPTTPVTTTSGPALTVSNDANTPPAGKIVQNSTGNTLAVFRFTDTSNSENVSVSQLNVVEAVTNSSVKSAFSNVRLYNGSTLLGVAASPVLDAAGTGYIYTFNSFSSPLIVPQASSLSLTLKGDAGSYVSGSITDGGSGTFEIVTTSDSGNNTSALAVVARGMTSNQAAAVTLSGAIGNPQTVVRTTLSVSGQSVSSYPPASFQQLGSITFTANSSGDAVLNSLNLTTNQTNSAFLNSLQLKDPSGNNIVAVDKLAQSSVSGSDVAWTFLRSTNPLVVTAGSSYTLSVWGDLSDLPGATNVSQSVTVTINNVTDFSYYDGTNSSAILQNLTAYQVPVTIANLQGPGMTASSVTIHLSDSTQYGTDNSTAFITTSIAAGSQNSQVTSWVLQISCPSGVTLIVPSKGGGSGVNFCGSSQTYYTSNMSNVNQQGNVLLTAGAANTNTYNSQISYVLTAYGSSGNVLGTSQDSISLSAPTSQPVSSSTPTLTILSPTGGAQFTAGSNITINYSSGGSFSTPNSTYFVYLKNKSSQLLGNNNCSGCTYYPVVFRGTAFPYPLTFTIPSSWSGTSYIELDYADTNGNPIASATSNAFTVGAATSPESIQVTYPSAGYSLSNGGKNSIATIQWTASNIPSGFGIALLNAAGTSVIKYLNNAALSPTATSFVWANDPSLPSGTYQIEVYSSEKGGGAQSLSGPFSIVTVQSTPTVSQVQNLVVAATTNTSITLSWSPATGTNQVGDYNIYRSTNSGFTPSNATLITSGNITSYTDPGLSAGTYYYVVTAQDVNGNVGPASAQTAYTIQKIISCTFGGGCTYAPSTPAAPVINSFSVNGNQQISLSAYNFSTITLQAQCGNFVDGVVSPNGTSVSYPTGSASLCNAPQYFWNSPTNEDSSNPPIVNAPMNLFNAQGVVDGSTSYIIDNTNVSDGSATLIANVCNTAGVCVQQSASFLVSGKACLAAGTKISMADGSDKSIENIKIGDVVKSFSRGVAASGVVTKIIQREDPIITINGTLKAASDEILFLANGKMEPAGSVKIGDKLFGEGGRAITVAMVAQSDELVNTYDLELGNGNAFFADGYLVQGLSASNL